MQRRVSRRGYEEHFCFGRHVHLTELKDTPAGFGNQYTAKVNRKMIPLYPRPEFHVTHLKHDTGPKGLTGIKSDGGFKAPFKNLLWWSLYVTPEDLQSAEKRLLEESYLEQTPEQAQGQQAFLKKFATSPSFLETSRFGSYRFIFPLNEVLDAYKEQFCSGENPIMRVYETVMYKQKVVYSVLVHSPAKEHLFFEYPLLKDEPGSICAFRDGCFIWRSEAMCKTHSRELNPNRANNQMEAVKPEGRHEYYLWDHVAIALHMEDGKVKVLRFDPDRLKENLRFCEKGKPVIRSSPDALEDENFHSFEEAQAHVPDWWPLKRSQKIK